MQSQAKFTQLLVDWREGQPEALDRLTPLVYEELRRLAHKYMRGERKNHTLQATAIVHEAFVRLVKADVSWQNRSHFFAVAARLMRRVLVDYAKGRARDKRFDPSKQVSMTRLEVPIQAPGYDLVDLDDALQDLAAIQPRHATVVELHYFGGLTYEQIAEVTDSSPATVHRDLRLARAWLMNELAVKPGR
jgi:RNA polymerase sigma factor (TIGR02999 family)